jgi:hypothetical protein
MISAILSWFAANGLTIVLGALAAYLKDIHAANASAQAQRDAGAASTAASVNKETADAERRAADAAVNAPDRDAVAGDLDAGKF